MLGPQALVAAGQTFLDDDIDPIVSIQSCEIFASPLVAAIFAE